MKAHSTAAAGALGVATLAMLATFGALGACSSGGNHGAPGAACNPCDPEGGALATSGHDANPYGVAYPSPPGGYGRKARSGNTPGSVMQNFKFLGYPNGDRSQGLQTIALADYYDPCQKSYKLLHLTVAGVWCGPCNQETDAIVGAKSQLDSERVAVLQALDDGKTQGVPATTSDLDYWMNLHKVNFTEMLDPGLTNLGGFFDAAAIPWNCDLDPRTMEIIDESTGWAGDVSTELQAGFNALPAQPGYPVPACN